MARETVKNEGQADATVNSESILQSGIDLVKNARNEAGELVLRLEENAGALKDKVQNTLEDLQEVSLADVPATIEKSYKTQTKRMTKQAALWKKQLLKGGKGIWKDILRQLKRAGTTLEAGVEPLIHTAGMASKRDIQRIEKKLERLIKQVSELEKGS